MSSDISVNHRKVLLLRTQSFLEKTNSHPRSHCVPWSLKYIQAFLIKNRCPVYFYDIKVHGHSERKAIKLVGNCNPDYIVIQSNLLEFHSCQTLLSEIKKSTKAKVILIGQYVSCISYNMHEADFVFKGESEEVVAKFILGTNKDKINQEDVYLVEDLDKLPFPYYTKGELCNYYYYYPINIRKKVIWGSILSSRGCPHRCIFCSQLLRNSYGERLRFRSAENVLNEIKYLKDLGANVISFEDDSFTLSRSHVNSICEKIISENIRLKWICHARIDEIDFDLLRRMKDAGCTLIRFGIESGSPRIIQILKKRKFGNEWSGMTKEVFAWTKKLKIATDAMFIIGSPSETENEIFISLKLAKILEPDMLQVCFFTLYPGSSAHRIFGGLGYREGKEPYHYDGSTSLLSRVGRDRLTALQKKFYRSVVFSPKFLFSHFIKYALYYIFNLDKTIKIFSIKNFI